MNSDIRFFLICFVRSFLLFSALSLTGLVHATWIPADHPHIQYLGRVSFSNPKAPAFSWTGVTIGLRFTGPSIAVRLRDQFSRYSVVINDAEFGVLEVRADQEKYIIAQNLGEGEHELKLIKRHESHWSKAEFLGVLLSHGHDLLPPPNRSKRRFEFLGDSYVACYGCESDRKDGDQQDYLQYTNVTKSFGSLVAKHYGAEAMILAYGGKGLARNSDDDITGRNFAIYYERTLHVGADRGWPVDAWTFESWIPQLVVIHLGINDFSGVSALPAFPAVYVERYEQFINSIRTRYSGARFLLMSTTDWPYGLMRSAVEDVIRRQEALGYKDVLQLHYDLKPEALHWHPSIRQHEEVAQLLVELIDKYGLVR